MSDVGWNLATCSYSAFQPWMGAPVRISLGAPRWWPDNQPFAAYITELTPRGWYFKKPREVYEPAFRKQLETAGVDTLHDLFRSASQRAGLQTLVLLCYEAIPGPSWCHRTIFADWWTEQTGEMIPEMHAMTQGGTPDQKPPEPDRLF